MQSVNHQDHSKEVVEVSPQEAEEIKKHFKGLSTLQISANILSHAAACRGAALVSMHQPLVPQTATELNMFAGDESGFVRIGPKGYLMHVSELCGIRGMEIRPNDVFVTTFPRSGTTWTQELVWLVNNDLDYTTATAVKLRERYSLLGQKVSKYDKVNHLLPKNDSKVSDIITKATQSTETLEDRAESRFIKTHLPLSVLPPNILDTAKMVYVARDPRDVAVSFYYYSRLSILLGYDGDFRTYWNLFYKGLVPRAPYFEHIKEAWRMRHHPNLLFIFYEELHDDLPATVRRVCEFFNKKYSDEQIDNLCKHLDFKNFQNNSSVNLSLYADDRMLKSGEEPFIRRGKKGGWRDHFDGEMSEQAETWMEHNLQDTDLKFPQ